MLGLLERSAATLALVGVVLLWEAVCRLLSIPAFVLPAPSTILAAAFDTSFAIWLSNSWATLQVVLIGFLISFAVSVPLAMVIVNSPAISRTIMPLLVIIQSTPIVAIAPIIVVTLRAGMLPRVAITCLITFFPLIVATTAGLRVVPEELIELSRSLKASRVRQYTQIRLPYAVPYVLSAAKVSVTLAVIGAVVAEFVAASEGLGYMILNYTSIFKLPQAFVTLTIILIISLTLYQIVSLIERVFFGWSLPQKD